jgi:hypothetical protein
MKQLLLNHTVVIPGKQNLFAACLNTLLLYVRKYRKLFLKKKIFSSTETEIRKLKELESARTIKLQIICTYKISDQSSFN